LYLKGEKSDSIRESEISNGRRSRFGSIELQVQLDIIPKVSNISRRCGGAVSRRSVGSSTSGIRSCQSSESGHSDEDKRKACGRGSGPLGGKRSLFQEGGKKIEGDKEAEKGI